MHYEQQERCHKQSMIYLSSSVSVTLTMAMSPSQHVIYLPLAINLHAELELPSFIHYKKIKAKALPYSIPSIRPGVDPSVQAVSPQVTVSHPPGGRLPLLSARPVVASSATEHHRPLVGTKLYCLVTEAHRCEQLA